MLLHFQWLDLKLQSELRLAEARCSAQMANVQR